MIPFFEIGNCEAGFFNYTNTFVSENPPGGATGYIALEDMQIRAADRGFGDLDDGVSR